MNNNLPNSKKILKETLDRIDGAYASSTIRAYKASFEEFTIFCEGHKKQALPASPLVTAQFIQSLIQRKLSSSTIRRTLSGIGTIHRLNRLNDPTRDPDVLIEMRRMHRQLGRAAKQANPITHEILERLINVTDQSLRGLRDKALLMVAYDTLCRRSELISLRTEDIGSPISNYQINGYSQTTILLRKSKTDPERTGKYLHITSQTYQALMEWLDKSKIIQGPIFRGINNSQDIGENLGAQEVNRILKRLSKKAKIDDSVIQGISGHSLRVGAAQDLAQSGVSLPMLMAKGRWSKTDTALRYIERMGLTLS